MQEARIGSALRILSYFVLLLMLSAGGYTFVISIVHWSGIGV